MNYGQFIYMFPECALVIALILVFALDFAMTKNGEFRGEKRNVALGRLTMFMLMSVGLAIFSAMRQEETITAFGGMYVATQAVNVMKLILTFGTFIVVIMADSWVETRQRVAGEFYMLILSTLLGMFVMMSSGNFLMFFLGLEMASVPLACMVAFDKDRKNSAEGAAKYILVATFSSGVMLFGISFIYAEHCISMMLPRHLADTILQHHSQSWDLCSSSVVLALRSHLCLSTSGLPTLIRVLQLQLLVT